MKQLTVAILMMLTVGYYAHKYGWGGDVKFEWPRLIKALSELAVVIGFPLAMWGLITLGLPFIRTSVDHGTALDLAGTGRADHTSLAEALKLASDLAQTS